MVSDLDRILGKMDRITSATKEAVKPALIKSANEIASLQRALAPVETGDLKNSISITGPNEPTPAYSQPGGSRMAGPDETIITAGNSDVRYPHLVEYGTSEADAQPFFWPGYYLGRDKAKRRIKAAARKAIRETWNNNKPGGDSDV
ncbi:HK97-gp10 family putative phage morphogenesis protein [Brucella grignonensis]|uniref:HK97 gp10 family phage protein n=1 Tax=Brucella grignonensis TaxID=94627 RepID=A0A256F7P8_9HYPH|nr:HK97-gp10 family putative phage morphogenesis protein [Brucella grignonensis]NKB83089.1 HK97 gp10 family phage protein [Brucella grignonensis]OYR10726.1 hypothetical protein CEV33_2191 [Brucella grignonensis]